MRIYIKGPNGEPLKPDEPSTKNKADEMKVHIREILEHMVELVPPEWEKTGLYVEIDENNFAYKLVYDLPDSARRMSKKAEQNLYGGRLYDNRRKMLVQAIRSAYADFAKTGAKWHVMSLVFSENGEYTAQFYESINMDVSFEERVENWKITKYGAKPAEENISARFIEIHKTNISK